MWLPFLHWHDWGCVGSQPSTYGWVAFVTQSG